MALFINQENNRTKLQERIAADLNEKAKQRAANEAAPVDGVDDSAYLTSTKRTTSLAWVWLLIVLVAGGLLVWLAIRQPSL